MKLIKDIFLAALIVFVSLLILIGIFRVFDAIAYIAGTL